jgi:AraC-like DNA-binding protein
MRSACTDRFTCVLSNLAQRAHDVTMSGEWSRYYAFPDLHHLDVLHARFIGHRFARHAHDYFVIGYVEQGVQAYAYRGARHMTPTDHVFLVNPGEVHTGEAATAGGYVYRTMYPRIALMEQVLGRGAPAFRDAVVHDAVLSRILKKFHAEVARQGSSLAIESWLLRALARTLDRYGEASTSSASRRVGQEHQAVRRAREYLDACFADDVSLSRLAAIAGLSPFHLARVFEHEVGLPPHVYLETVRIARSRVLLESGRPIADVALDVGYADQSHFTHRFKRVMGMAPGQYVRERIATVRLCDRRRCY